MGRAVAGCAAQPVTPGGECAVAVTRGGRGCGVEVERRGMFQVVWPGAARGVGEMVRGSSAGRELGRKKAVDLGGLCSCLSTVVTEKGAAAKDGARGCIWIGDKAV